MDVVGDILSTMESAASAIRMPDTEPAVKEAYAKVIALIERNYGWANTGLFRQKLGLQSNRIQVRRSLEYSGVTEDIDLINAVRTLAHVMAGGNGLSEQAGETETAASIPDKLEPETTRILTITMADDTQPCEGTGDGEKTEIEPPEGVAAGEPRAAGEVPAIEGDEELKIMNTSDAAGDVDLGLIKREGAELPDEPEKESEARGLLRQLNRSISTPAPGIFNLLENELAAIEALTNRYLTSTTRAMAKINDILHVLPDAYNPLHPDGSLIHRAILPALATPLLRKLEELDYWEAYCEKLDSRPWSFLPDNSAAEAEVIWLHQLEMLRAKYQPVDSKLYGLAKITADEREEISYNNVYRWLKVTDSSGTRRFVEYAAFIVNENGEIEEACNPMDRNQLPGGCDFTLMTPEEFSVFSVGLVLEVFRLVSRSLPGDIIWSELQQLFNMD